MQRSRDGQRIERLRLHGRGEWRAISGVGIPKRQVMFGPELMRNQLQPRLRHPCGRTGIRGATQAKSCRRAWIVGAAADDAGRIPNPQHERFPAYDVGQENNCENQSKDDVWPPQISQRYARQIHFHGCCPNPCQFNNVVAVLIGMRRRAECCPDRSKCAIFCGRRMVVRSPLGNERQPDRSGELSQSRPNQRCRQSSACAYDGNWRWVVDSAISGLSESPRQTPLVT